MQNKKIELNDKQSNTSPSSAKGSTKKILDKIEINPKQVDSPKSMYERTDDAVAETTVSELVAEMNQQLSSEGLLDEAVLNLQQRLKRRTIMRQYKTKIAAAKERAQRKMADQPHLKARAEKAARNVARKRFAGQRGVQYQELSPSDKIAVDKLIDKKGALIKKIASRLLPRIRKQEIQRLASFRSGEAMKPEHTPANLMKEDDMMTFAEATAPRKRGRPASAATLAKRAAAPKNKDMDDEDDYGPDNGREPDQNIIMQLHKAISMDGKKEVNFDQGGSAYVKPNHAEKALSHYNNLKKPAEKLEFIKKISTSHKHLKQAINEDADLLTIIENVMDRIDEDSMLSEEAVEGLKKKAEKSGMPLGVLKKVFKRGMGAYKSSHRPGTTPQQWAFARVNSFIAGGKTTKSADADLYAKVQESVDEACWDGYKQVGLKDKNGKKVPDCVPVKEAQTPQEKFKAGLKKSGYDPDAGAKRLTDLIAKQKAERAEHEKKYGHLYSEEEFKLDEEEVNEAGVLKNFKRFVTGKLPSDRASAEGEKMIDAHSAGDKESMMKHAKRAEKFDRLTNKPVNEDAASHLRTAAALQAKGKPQLASIHKKIAIALGRGDTTSAKGYGKELSRVKSVMSMNKESIDESIQYEVIDYSNMKPVAAPTMVEMKEYMPSIQSGFEHHPSVAKLLSIKEMRAQQKLTVKNQTRDNMEKDPEDQIFAGSYRTQHFEASPEAQKLYMNLPKDVDPNVAAASAVAHDKLFHIFKKVSASDFATPEDIAIAKTHVSHIMKFAKSMNLEKEHDYVNDMMRQITDAKTNEVDRPLEDNIADDLRFQSLPKDMKQEVGPGNDKDIDNLKDYKISRNLKAQRKLKIIDND